MRTRSADARTEVNGTQSVGYNSGKSGRQSDLCINDNRSISIAQRKLQQLPDKNFSAVQLVQTIIIDPGASHHYDDVFGIAYGIRNDDQLKARLVAHAGTGQLLGTSMALGNHYGRSCSIKWRTTGNSVTVYHCGPSS